MLTCIDHLGLHAEETSHTAEQLGSNSRMFSHPSLIGAAFGLDHVLGRALTPEGRAARDFRLRSRGMRAPGSGPMLETRG
ncbi:hypothetical protein ACFV2U_46145 [Streptomyces sp. NPDC059697]|uniref:hypothetical protein n=1 Tax=Streptomyces sp. NPDC059697 TaxID=3346912 RepID=UPI0036B7A140